MARYTFIYLGVVNANDYANDLRSQGSDLIQQLVTEAKGSSDCPTDIPQKHKVYFGTSVLKNPSASEAVWQAYLAGHKITVKQWVEISRHLRNLADKSEKTDFENSLHLTAVVITGDNRKKPEIDTTRL